MIGFSLLDSKIVFAYGTYLFIQLVSPSFWLLYARIVDILECECVFFSETTSQRPSRVSSIIHPKSRWACSHPSYLLFRSPAWAQLGPRQKNSIPSIFQKSRASQGSAVSNEPGRTLEESKNLKVLRKRGRMRPTAENEMKNMLHQPEIQLSQNEMHGRG